MTIVAPVSDQRSAVLPSQATTTTTATIPGKETDGVPTTSAEPTAVLPSPQGTSTPASTMTTLTTNPTTTPVKTVNENLSSEVSGLPEIEVIEQPQSAASAKVLSPTTPASSGSGSALPAENKDASTSHTAPVPGRSSTEKSSPSKTDKKTTDLETPVPQTSTTSTTFKSSTTSTAVGNVAVHGKDG